MNIKDNQEKKAALRDAVSKINPEQTYPVSYTISNEGARLYGNTKLLGKDLTENQILELLEKELL